MTLRAIALSGVAAASLLGPHAGEPDGAAPPPPDRIVIDVATVNGSGCPAGTAAVAVSPDNEAFTVSTARTWPRWASAPSRPISARTASST